MKDRCGEMLALCGSQCTRVAEVPGCGRSTGENPGFFCVLSALRGPTGLSEWRCDNRYQPNSRESQRSICDIDAFVIVYRGSLSGYSAVWLARLTGGQEVVGSNPASPIFLKPLLNRQLRYLTAFVSAAKSQTQSWNFFHEMNERHPQWHASLIRS